MSVRAVPSPEVRSGGLSGAGWAVGAPGWWREERPAGPSAAAATTALPGGRGGAPGGLHRQIRACGRVISPPKSVAVGCGVSTPAGYGGEEARVAMPSRCGGPGRRRGAQCPSGGGHQVAALSRCWLLRPSGDWDAEIHGFGLL